MGEAILSRQSDEYTVSVAVIEVETFANKRVTVTCQNTDGRKLRKISNGLVRFNVSLGVWTVSCTADGKEYKKEIDVIESKMYKVELRGMTYGVQVDMSTMTYITTYIDDSEGFEPYTIGGENPIWDNIITDFIGCRPCMVKDGVRTKYLQANDYTKYEDGTDADITSGDAGIVMVEFKKNWYKYSVENDILKFEIANYDRSADGFVQDAFRSIEDSSIIKNYLYYAAYPCSGLSGGDIYHGGTLRSWRNTLQSSHGSSYAWEDWTRRMYISGLIMLLFKTVHPANFGLIGSGFGSSTKYKSKPGCHNKSGLFAERYSGPSDYDCIPSKIFGMECFLLQYATYDGRKYPIDGFLNDTESGPIKYKKFPPYTELSTDYSSVDVIGLRGISYILKVQSPDSSIVLPSVLGDSTTGSLGDSDPTGMHINGITGGYYTATGLFGMSITTANVTDMFLRLIMV